ncbi:MAG: hypothetical protein HW416_2560 [Chloroflexi bacterium]|nr:hypothetical protein [Chloroflexota bacterium]
MEIEFEIGGVEVEINGLKGIATLLGFGLVTWALVRELATPSEKRQWHGQLGGLIPYDFRLPTVDRMVNAYCDPESDRVFTDMPFGVGWGINVAGLVRRIVHSCTQPPSSGVGEPLAQDHERFGDTRRAAAVPP